MSTFALVTGGNRGIGLAVCEGLASLRIKVLLGSRNKRKGNEAAKHLQSKGLDVSAIQLDVSDKKSIEKAFQEIQSSYGPIDILDTIIWLATLPESGPTGRFFRDRKEIPW